MAMPINVAIIVRLVKVMSPSRLEEFAPPGLRQL
jgi:hypothetical protein